MQKCFEHLPEIVKIIYAKVKSSPTVESFLDALRQLLDELEHDKDTAHAFEYFIGKLNGHERRSLEHFQEIAKWIEQMLTRLATGNSMGAQDVRRVNEHQKLYISYTKFGNDYLSSRINLLRRCMSAFVKYGDFSLFEKWARCSVETSKISFTKEKDPLKACQSPEIILPDSDEGIRLREALGHGFIDAQLDLSGIGDARMYTLRLGLIENILPEEIEEKLCKISGNSNVAKDSLDNPILLLKHLLYLAYWREWMAEEVKKSDEQLHSLANNKQNIFLSQNYFNSLLISDINNVREELLNSIDRFLILIQEEVYLRKCKNKERAINYAYGKVKEKFRAKTYEERCKYTYDQIIDLIMTEVESSNLPFDVNKTNCRKACETFAEKYGWLPKRKKSQEKRVDPTRW